MGTRKALLIGAEHYGAGFKQVRAVENDLELMAEALNRRGFECQRLEADIVANQGRLERAISEWCQAGPEDVRVVYFTGHGVAYKGKDFIVPAGVSRDETARGAQIVPTDYSQLVSESETGHVLFIIDACRDAVDGGSQWAGGRDVANESRFVRFLGCGSQEESWTIPAEGGGEVSVFTRALADVLATGIEGTLPRVREATREKCAELQKYPDRRQRPRFDVEDIAGDEAGAFEFFPHEPLVGGEAWLKLGADDTIWVVVLQSEGARRPLAKTVRTSLAGHKAEIERQARKPLDEELRVVDINEALESPRRWLRTVEALCKAPVVVAEATGFEPGVMLCLGVRAVVRRGVTLTATTRAVNESKRSELPFNIQQIKLIGAIANDIKHPQHALNLTGSALADGLRQLRENPAYHDLPGFDSVRCVEPPEHPRSVHNTVLVLCPFHQDYLKPWNHLSNQLAPQSDRLIDGSEAPPVVRMLDMESPRLVGPALYEHLRWSRACVADWSFWRANVFFELGVRLACSEFAPVSVITTDELEKARGPAALAQHRQLRDLFQPIPYRVSAEDHEDDDEDGIEEALARNEAILHGKYAEAEGEVPPNATYKHVRDWFDWRQERNLLSPDEEMRRLIEDQLGKDQKTPTPPTLFSKNKAYLAALRHAAQERWIAAWRYLRTRYPDEEIEKNPELRQRLTDLGEEFKQSLPNRRIRTKDQKLLKQEIDEFTKRFPVPGAGEAKESEP